MPEVEGAVVISRPVEDVFAYMSDPQNSTKWEPGVVVSEFTSEGGPHLGAKVRRVVKLEGMTIESTWEITEYEQNKAFGVTFESQQGKQFKQFAECIGWEFASDHGGTRVVYRVRGEARGIVWKLLLPWIMPLLKWRFRKDYAKLKGLLESGG